MGVCRRATLALGVALLLTGLPSVAPGAPLGAERVGATAAPGDYVVTAAVRLDGVAAGMFFRAATTTNGYMWQLRPGSPGVLREHKVVNGAFTVLRDVALPIAVTTGGTYQLSIRAQGTSFTSTVNGTPVDVISDSTFASGSVGVRTGFYETMSLDSLSVRDLDGRLLFDDDFSDPLANRLACGTATAGRLVVDRIKACVATSWDTTTAPTSLRVDQQVRPLVASTTALRFGWRPSTAQQSASRVVVSSTRADALAQVGVWDSGKVTSTLSQQVPFGGTPLAAATRYWWSLQTWDAQGIASAWSSPAEFGTATDSLATVPPIWARVGSIGSEWTDYTFNADARIDETYAAVLFRAHDTANGYLWQLRPGSPGTLVAHKVVNGTYTTLATVNLGIAITVGTYYRLSIMLNGSTITTAIDGVQKDTRIDTTFAFGTIGVRTAGAERMSVDNVDVRSSANQVLYATDFATETVAPFACGTLSSAAVSLDRSKSCLVLAVSNDWAFLRGSFTLPDKAVQSATLFAAGRRTVDSRQYVFSTWVNASFVAPGPTYTGEDSTAYFGGWDVTPLMVRNAENVIGIQAYATINRSFVGQLVVQFTDGSRSVVTTSTAWRARAGGDVYPNPASITKAPAYFNAPVENLDMRVYPDGFAAVGSVGTNWLPAVAAPVVPGLKPMAAPAVERQLKTPASVTQLEGAGHFLVDFGRSWVGGIELAVAGTSGQTVDVRMGERLTAAGNAVEYDAPSGVKYRDVWTLRDGQQTVRHWGYRVFRYVELIGLPPSFQPSDVRAAALVYPFDRSSSALLTSNPTLDRVWQFSKDSIESLNVDLYMDSPTRERAPYEADAYDQMLAHHYTEGDLALGKVSLDWLMPKPTWPTEWKAYTIMSAYQYWLASGDTTWLTANYATLQARLMPAQYFNTAGLVEKPATQSLTGDDIVDWPYTNRDSYKFTTINTVVNAFTYRSLMDIAAIALVVGKGDDAAAYTARATTLRTAINTTLFDTTVGKYRDGAVGAAATHYSVHASVFAVALGVAAATEKPAAVSYIAQRGMACSLYCAPFLLQALFENGRAARAIELMTSAAVPGWIAMMDTFGAGATMEAWNPTLKPNTTYSHPAGASPAFVVPRFVFGVRPTGPAYSSFTVEPSPGTLTSGSTKVPTVRGTITVSFGNPGDGNGVTVAVPTTTTATVSLVAATGMALLVDGVSVPATRTPDGSRLSLTVGPGTHVVAVP